MVSQHDRPPQIILVVDDDPAVLSSLKFSLETEGFTVEVFHAAEDLLARAPLPDHACLVVDYRLPSMDGIEMVAQLRRQGVNLPAILITTGPSRTIRRRAVQARMAIVEKPLLGAVLADTIRAALA